MSSAITIFAQLLGFMAALIVLGEPLRLLLSKFSKLFKTLDFIEICVLDVYLGGLVLYVLALPPIHLFNTPTIFGLVLFSGLVLSIYYWRWKKRPQILTERKKGLQRRTMILEYTLVFGMFLITLYIQTVPLTFFIYGSIHDASLHSIWVQVILENGHIPSNLQPYLPEGIIYPQGSHVIFAFAAVLIGWIAPNAVFYVTPLFSALTVLGAYFLARRIWCNRSFYLSLVFIFAFVSTWPISITWGGSPFVLGFALFLICLGLLVEMLSTMDKTDKKQLLVIGILFGYLSAIMISFLQSLLIIMVFWLLFQLPQKSAKRKHLLEVFILLFFVSLIPLSPFLFRFVSYYPYPGHNVGLPQDFAGYPLVQTSLAQVLQWTFENLSPYVALRIEMICIIIISIILFLKFRKENGLRKIFQASLFIFVASIFLSFISYILSSAHFGVVSWGHQGIILTISLCLLLSIFNSGLPIFFGRISSKFCTAVFKKKSDAVLLVSVLLLSAVYAPFVYMRLIGDISALKGAYGMFAITTEDDNNLMLWIKENLNEEAMVLVNRYEPGAFIPAVSHRKTVYTTPGSQLSRSYQELIGLIRNNILNATSYIFIKNLNITHVYVGSDATYWWIHDYKWKPQLFLGNPNFPLMERIGNAYLFNFSYNDPYVVFLDDFEHDSWYDYGWQTYFEGNGLGNVAITTNFGCNDSSCLRMSAQTAHTVSEWKYIRWIRREIFVMSNSDVRLSFYLNATEGFHGRDAFAVLISNVYHNQSMVITTPNGIHEDYNYTIPLDGFKGSFNCSLSMMWHEMFNSSLPNPFILEFVNYDFDGIENVVYIDNIKVTSTPND